MNPPRIPNAQDRVTRERLEAFFRKLIAKVGVCETCCSSMGIPIEHIIDWSAARAPSRDGNVFTISIIPHTKKRGGPTCLCYTFLRNGTVKQQSYPHPTKPVTVITYLPDWKTGLCSIGRIVTESLLVVYASVSDFTEDAAAASNADPCVLRTS